jgi:hypothetical protein
MQRGTLQLDLSVPSGETSSAGLALAASSNAFPVQPIYFDNLPRSAASSQKSPLSFHALAHCFLCNHFIFTYLSKMPGVTPCFHNSNGISIFPSDAAEDPAHHFAGGYKQPCSPSRVHNGCGLSPDWGA